MAQIDKDSFLAFLDNYMGSFSAEDENVDVKINIIKKIRNAVTGDKFAISPKAADYDLQDDIKQQVISIIRDDFTLDGSGVEGVTPVTDALCRIINKINVIK